MRDLLQGERFRETAEVKVALSAPFTGNGEINAMDVYHRRRYALAKSLLDPTHGH
jgi:predicted nucleotidyltransferase